MKMKVATLLVACATLLASQALAGTRWEVRIKNNSSNQLTVTQEKSACWRPGSFEKPSSVRPGESQEFFSEMDDLKECSSSVNKEWYQDIVVKSENGKTHKYKFSFNKRSLRASGDWASLSCDKPSACCSTCRVSISID